MQVILMEKMTNLGGLGDVVKVKDGFARNYLIPQGKAKRATQANLKEFEGRRVELEKKANEQLTGAQDRAAKLEGQKVDIAQKAGVDGRLFGSVTNADIAESLAKTTGVKVKKAEVRMPQGPIKHIGEFPIVVALHSDVLANIVVHVVAESCGKGRSFPRRRRHSEKPPPGRPFSFRVAHRVSLRHGNFPHRDSRETHRSSTTYLQVYPIVRTGGA